MHLLVRRVRTGDGRADRNHIHVRVRLLEQTALETGVDHLNVRRFVEQRDIGLTGQRHNRRVGVRLPARIAAFRFSLRASQLAEGGQHLHHVVAAGVDQRTDQAVNLRLVMIHGDHADVQRGFHHAFRHVGVADNAVRRAVQQIQEAVAALCAQRLALMRQRLGNDVDVLLVHAVLVLQRQQEVRRG